jgi:RNA polymerase sigma-70 factor (ECF subfamily)
VKELLMDPTDAEATSTTLLRLLREQPADAAAWDQFVRRYQPRIYAFCRAAGLPDADAQDVTQTVLLNLVVKLRDFRYDPARSFRAWLRTVTRNILSDFRTRRSRDQGSGDSAILRLLDNVEAQDGLARELEGELDRELLEEALRRVQPRVPPQQWDAFRLTVLEGLSGAAAAARLNMLVATVYTAKSKVQKLVRQEIDRLEYPSA